ncbi:MAG: A/G-specific adenine glycosylase [Mycobacteriales bacterium]
MQSTLIAWFGSHARELPWRADNAAPWAVLVSEVMLQQTPVNRVLPVYTAWLERWPTPAALAADTVADAIRAWARLGYPRRALRLHACATVIADRFGNEVPRDIDDLLGLPGVGSYTAAAVATFAYGQRHAVVDVNVRRVLARAVRGVADAGPATTTADMALMAQLLPTAPRRAVRFCAAVMELGAVICRAQQPACHHCPLARRCTWRRAGSPELRQAKKRTQRYDGTDRQVRGRLLAALRDASQPLEGRILDDTWHLPQQRLRALNSLLSDRLVEQCPDGRYALAGEVLLQRT